MELATKEDFDALNKKVDDLTATVLRMNEQLHLSDVLYVKDIAKMEDLSVSGIKKAPWLLPDFGESEYPNGHTRWSVKKVREWRDIPVKTRLSMWHTHIRNVVDSYKGA